VPVRKLSPSFWWQVPAGIGGGVLVLTALVASPPWTILLATMGGALVAVALVPLVLWTPPVSVSASEAERLEAMASAFQEGLLDLYSLYDVSRVISSTVHLDQLLTTTMKRVAQTTGIESHALFLLDDSTNVLVSRSLSGAAHVLEHVILQVGEGIAGTVFRTRVPEMHTGPAPLPWVDVPKQARSVIAIPLVGREHVLGALLLYSVSPSAFSERELAYFTAVGKQLSIALDNATLLQKATELSYRDPLTDLFNRRYLEEALETEVRRAARYNLPLSVTMADIDYFKAYNDRYGHSKGDQVLRAVATRLREQTRNADIVTRYGGEEFVIIFPMTTKAHARLVAEKLRAAVAVMKIDGSTELTVSIGVATFPNDASTAIGLVQAADAALYAAKDAGRNRVEVFNDSDG
jgi:diguanylate cyclase (GGDEF)-like protein